jgi:hypothetical protein
MKASTSAIPVLLSAFAAPAGFAQPSDQLPPELAPYVKIVDGAKTPTLIAKIDYVRSLLDQIDMVRLSGEDRAIAAQLKVTAKERQRAGSERVRNAYTESCKQVNADVPQTAVVQARAVQQAQDQSDAELLALYDGEVAKLSPSGRSILTTYIAQEVLPRMGTTTVDIVGFVSARPELAAPRIAQRCVSGPSNNPNTASPSPRNPDGNVEIGSSNSN